MLCDNPWNGGGGYLPQQVAEMTPDQIYFRLCDIDLLKDVRTKSVSVETGTIGPVVDEEGMVKGRLADGTVVKMPLRVGGKSLAQRLAEEAEKNQKEVEGGKRRRRRRGT